MRAMERTERYQGGKSSELGTDRDPAENAGADMTTSCLVTLLKSVRMVAERCSAMELDKLPPRQQQPSYGEGGS